MTEEFPCGKRVRVGRRWFTCVSAPISWGGSRLYRWRSGARCTVPELVDWAAERRLRRAPPPPEPPDPLDRFTVVRARA